MFETSYSLLGIGHNHKAGQRWESMEEQPPESQVIQEQPPQTHAFGQPPVVYETKSSLPVVVGVLYAIYQALPILGGLALLLSLIHI